MRCATFFAAFAALVIARPVSAETLKVVVQSAVVTPDLFTMKSIITLKLKADSKVAIREFTKVRVGENVTLRIGDQVLSEPIVNEPITEGTLVINGGFTDEQARILADAIMRADGIVEVDGSDK